MRLNLGLLIVLCSSQCWGAQGDFYQEFLRILDTNDVWGYAITSPLLVDTNNTAPKLTNAVLSIKHIKERGELARIRLGMSMDEVVSKLGKPPCFWSANRGGGPCFQYTGLDVIFTPGSNNVMKIWVPDDSFESVRFEEGVSAGSTLDKWLDVIGEPARRGEWLSPAVIWLEYESPTAIILAIFDSEKELLRSFRLERRATIESQKPDRSRKP